MYSTKYRQGIQNIARAVLADRVLAGVLLPNYVTVLIFAEEADYQSLFSDPVIAAVAPHLSVVQDKNRQVGNPVVNVPNWKR